MPSLRAAISSNLPQVSDCSPLPFQTIPDATKQWDALSKAVMDAAVDMLGYSTRKCEDWFGSNDAEIQKLLDERNAAFAAELRNPTSVELRPRWALHRSQLQKRLREMENTWWFLGYRNSKLCGCKYDVQFHEAVKWVYQCWEFATGSPQNCKCGANFFIADFRHANLVFATCALRAQLSFLRIVRNRKRQKCTGDHFRKFPIKLVSAQ